ncbi:MAG: WD40/YVTN/BNR-like repeat-containing protein [Bradymonadia bacterium]
MRARVSLLLAWALTSAPVISWAHSSEPQLTSISFSPYAAESLPWITDHMGVFVSDEDQWRWVCAEALSPNDPNLVVDALSAAPTEVDGSRWLVSTTGGLRLMSADGCEIESITSGPLDGHQPGVLSPHPERPGEVLTVTTSLGRPNDVFRTTDGGETWQAAGLSINGRVTGLARSPSAPDRIYVSSADGVMTSADGGMTWTTQPLLGPFWGVPQSALVVAAVDPANPDRVFALLERFPDGYVLRSDDGGATWTGTLTILDDRPTALAISADGALLVSTAFSGLRRSEDAGETWSTLESPTLLYCLVAGTSGFWGCSGADWQVARTQSGSSWAPQGDYATLAVPVTCPEDSWTSRRCAALTQPDMGVLPDAGSIQDAGLMTDAGADVDAAPTSGGGCTQPSGAGHASWLFLLMVYCRTRRV